MFDLISQYEISFMWILVIAILILAGFSYWFTKDKFGYAFLGILRIIASIIYSPLLYFKNRFINLTQFGEKGDTGITETKQFLLNKLLIILEGFAIIIGVFVISTGLISSWNSFLPPQYLRVQIEGAEKYIHSLDSTFQAAKTKLESFDKDWNGKKDQLIQNFKDERGKNKSAAEKENITIAAQLSSNVQFQDLKNYLDVRNYLTDKSSIEYTRTDLENYFYYNSPDENLKNTFKKYGDNWITIKLADIDISNFSDDDLRNGIQPEYSNLKNQESSYNSEVGGYKTNLENMKAEAKYSFKSLLIGLLITFLTFVLYMWFLGLLLEMIFLMVDLAANVKKIRSNLESNQLEKKE